MCSTHAIMPSQVPMIIVVSPSVEIGWKLRYSVSSVTISDIGVMLPSHLQLLRLTQSLHVHPVVVRVAG